MQVAALASGSSGNALLIRVEGLTLLVDAGLSLPRLAAALAGFGLTPADLDLVLLTHEHHDHALAVPALQSRLQVPVLATAGTWEALGQTPRGQTLVPGRWLTLPGDLAVLPVPVPHDATEPVGFFLTHPEARVFIATDLGHVPESLGEYLAAADLVILEANHDPHRLRSGPYPPHLKARVASPLGHLANEQTASALIATATGRPRWVWLAHLSQVNNTPQIARQTVEGRLRAAGLALTPVGVARRDRPSLVWDARRCYQQLPLF